jgi:hypothetical protein
MLSMDRWFDISKIERALGYRPLVDFEDAWPAAVDAIAARLAADGELPGRAGAGANRAKGGA